MDITKTLGIRAAEKVQSLVSVTSEGEGGIGYVHWIGPGPLILPAGSDCRAVCSVKLEKPLNRDVLMVDASPIVPLPAGVLLQPMVVPSSEVRLNQLSVLVCNESERDAVLPVGTLMGNLCIADSVVPALQTKIRSKAGVTELDPSLIDFGDSPIPAHWKARL